MPATAIVPLLRAVRDALRDVTATPGGLSAPTRVVVGLSGGRDSMALLDAAAIESCGIDPGARPETLAPAEFGALARLLPSG